MTRQNEPIRLRPDGSIDTAYYIARSRRLRGEQAHHLGGAVLSSPGRLMKLLRLPARLMGRAAKA